jgi:hypothetical protein
VRTTGPVRTLASSEFLWCREGLKAFQKVHSRCGSDADAWSQSASRARSARLDRADRLLASVEQALAVTVCCWQTLET